MNALWERCAPWLMLALCLLVTLIVLRLPGPAAPAAAPAQGLSPAPRFAGEALFLRPFAPEEPVWHGAPGLWKTHNGLDVACEEAAALLPGTVLRVERDALWGTSVTVGSDGTSVVYRSLSSCAVREGQQVLAGDVLGAAGAAPCEAELGAHVHIEYRAQGQLCDPQTLLP